MAHYSIIIKGGTVIDGTGSPRRPADIGIALDKIRTIGDLSDDSADRIIDANDRYITPGFIDITNHSDTHWTIFNDPSQDSLLTQGVTTILGGNCGISLAPFTKAGIIESIRKWVDVSGINVNWQTFGELLLALDKMEMGVNFASLVGHGTLRRGIIGDEDRPASDEEIRKMCFLLEEALKGGAFGVSTSLGSSHGKPAADDELIEIFKTTKKYNALTKHHLADEGKNILPALSRILSLARLNGTAAHISHFKAIGRKAWDNFNRAIIMMDKSINEGVKASCDIFPYTKTGSNLYMLLPEWTLGGGRDEIIKRVKDKNERGKIINALRDLTLHYDKMIVATAPRSPASVGKTISEISSSSGLSPEEVLLDLLEVNSLRVAIFNEVISEDNIQAAAKKQYTAVASDGVGYNINEIRGRKDLPHPRSFGTFPKFLADFARIKEIISWEEAIYKMSGLPAKILGLADRGTVSADAFADIAVINPETIQDFSTYENPFQLSRGVDWLLVNGQPAIERGVLTGAMNGKVLRKSEQ